ncbi:r-opsin [Schistosoma bovis]|uniref:R-opsin n=1 Tax=Schistosoma bovis TaxID=6184 RepID=A0A430QAU0_SCHBO|nr:r-opsin [Schistosoma bovis]
MKQNLTFATLWPDDNDFMSIVHPHWHKFTQPDPLYYYLVGIYIGIVGILAVMGNSLVITLFLLSKQLRTPPNMLIVNLAISDFSFALINGFPLKTIASFNQRWGWGKLACELYGFAGSIFGFISLTTMAFIALDRYLVISQPFKTFSRITYGKVIVMIFITWIWSALWSIPPFFGYVRLNELELMKMAQSLNAQNPSAMKTGKLDDIRVILLLSEILNNTFLETLYFIDCDKKADIEAAKTSIILVLLYLMSWSPYAIVCLMTLVGSRDSLTPFHSELPVLFAKTSAVYNPIVYAVKHPKFRLEIEKRFPFLICCCPPKPKERLQNTIVSKIQVSQIGIGTASRSNENTLNTAKQEN